jgi:hypothetical protein
MFMIADIATHVKVIRRILEEMKRKRISKARLEQIRREVDNDPNIRRLRELAERGQAELDARKRAEAARDE